MKHGIGSKENFLHEIVLVVLSGEKYWNMRIIFVISCALEFSFYDAQCVLQFSFYDAQKATKHF